MRALVRHLSEGVGRVVLTVVAAVLIGLGVPLLWVWIGSILQGDAEGTTVSGATAAAMLVGIVLTYFFVLVIGGWIQSRFGTAEADDRPAPVRYPWNRSMRDEPYRPGEGRLSPLESAFVFTAVLATLGFLVWFFAFAGSPLPSG
jgi:hypothetical protein